MTKLTMILGMALVTYLPRLLPFFIIKGHIKKDLEIFLKIIPYTALGALVIPGVFTAVDHNLSASLVGAIVAVLISWFNKNLVITVLASIVATYLMMIL